MSIKLNIKKKLVTTSERVKSTDIHTLEPWFLVSLYNGTVNIWNYETGLMIKSFNVSTVPVRMAKFISKLGCFVAGCDDSSVQVHNYNTMSQIISFEAHSDFVRCLAVHNSKPYLITAGDDMLIKLWDWENNWKCVCVFEGHHHYIMELKFSPKDPNIFISASLDKTLKIWQLGMQIPNSTIDAHATGANSVDYSTFVDKPYIASGGDDFLIKIWDYQNKSCVQTLSGHNDNVITVVFHPDLPLLISGSEDGTVKIWNTITYKLESTQNFNIGRVWTISVIKGSSCIVVGGDNGCVYLQLCEDHPTITMDVNGKVLMGRNSEILQGNTKLLSDQQKIKDGEKIMISLKELGHCEIFPQSLIHSPNGKFVVVLGSTDFIVYTSVALRSKCFGPQDSFAWGRDTNSFVTYEQGPHSLKLYKNFKIQQTINLKYHARERHLFTGVLLGVSSETDIDFYMWDNLQFVHRISVAPLGVYWNFSSSQVCVLCTSESTYNIKYNVDIVENAIENGKADSEDGIDEAMELNFQIDCVVSSGVWVGDCFIFVSNLNKLCYSIEKEVVVISHLSGLYYILNYIQQENKVYLSDKQNNLIFYTFDQSLLNFQTLVLRDPKNKELINKLLGKIGEEHYDRLSYFLEARGFLEEAYGISREMQHKFSLTIKLKKFDDAFKIAKSMQDTENWKIIAQESLENGRLDIARESLWHAKDFAGLIFLCYIIRDAGTLKKIAAHTTDLKQYNFSFLAYYLLRNFDKCIEILQLSGRFSEATLMSYTHEPKLLEKCFEEWKKEVMKHNEKAASLLASPKEYPELFEGLRE